MYEVARHHHEKWNGKGYPDGLEGKGDRSIPQGTATVSCFSENRFNDMIEIQEVERYGNKEYYFGTSNEKRDVTG